MYANYIVDSGWKTTVSGNLNKGANSWNWIAKVTFTVPGPGPAVLIASDRNFVSELVAIFDATGTTVSGSSTGMWRVALCPVWHLLSKETGAHCSLLAKPQ